ncbi:MAG: hypothetical protein LKI38_07225 [Actinomyces sp.]|nr:glycoside hydrolase family 38 C-terminal domain-containing protein [Actinomyces sp.]MCI1642296.1 hypothetical protein [Actinomyces sp.]
MTARRGEPAMWLVPHTHWDREWYEPHDVFRARLVMMVDGLLDLLEAEPECRFTLDGQAAAVLDYLEIRPGAAGRVRGAVERGQLDIGPFLILLDEFCCDGESIVRNLELGVAACEAMGGAMRVGYLPDMFGHAAQMPQILRGFGLADAALWRGVPAGVERDAFMWQALDGEAVRVEYLWDGYGSALKLFEPPEKADRLIGAYLERHARRFAGAPPAGMYGTDHMAPRTDLMGMVRAHNRSHPGTAVGVATLGQVVASRDHSDPALAALPVVRGEMRSHALGNILPGVLSVRTGLKQAMAQAERALTTAERFDAWIGGPDRAAFFARGWGLVVESSAHDSVTGCGADSTAEEVEARLHVAAHVARGAIDTGLADLGRHAPSGDVAVYNPSGWDMPVQAELVVEGEPSQLPGSVQLLEVLGTTLGDEDVAARDLPRILRRIHGRELFGRQIREWGFPAPGELRLVVADIAPRVFNLDAFATELERRRRECDPGQRWRVRIVTPPSMRVLVGARAPGTGVVAVGTGRRGPHGRPVRAGGAWLDNGLVRVEVEEPGTVSVTDLPNGRTVRGALALVDEGDRGDSYNFGPLDAGAVGEPARVSVSLLEGGPLRGRLGIDRTYRLPAGLDAEDRSRRSSAVVDQVVRTTVELREEEPFARVCVDLVNAAADHRLRVLVPTGERGVDGSASAGQYGVTVRGRGGEGGWGEYPLPTYPATRFVSAGGIAIHTDRLMEYEVVDGDPADAIALTVVRAVGLMSVNLHPLRDEPAGSEIPVPGAQYLGRRVRTEFAIDLSCPDWSGSDVVRHSDQFRLAPVVAEGTGPAADRGRADGLAPGGRPTARTTGRVCLESLRRRGDGLEARFVNYHHRDEVLGAMMGGLWDRVGLDGRIVEELVDPATMVVPASTILTLRTHAGTTTGAETWPRHA